MGNAFIQESTLTAIGDAIRAKTGSTDLMLPGDMAVAIEGMELGGKSGSYVWTKQGVSDNVVTYQMSNNIKLTTADDSIPSTEIEISSAAPTYDATKRQWIFASSTKVTLVNSDDVLPSISGNVYVRVMSEPNVWHLVNAFAKGSSSPYKKIMKTSANYIASRDWAKKYLTDVDEEKYPVGGWSDGYYYERIVADPLLDSSGKTWTQSNVTDDTFNSVYYGNGVWVAGAFRNGLYYSTDGKTWTQSNVTSGDLNFVYYANGLWVAGSNSGYGLYYSTDGKTWTQGNVTSGRFDSLYYDNSLWVAGSFDDAGLYYSIDGKTWTQSNVMSGSFASVYYGNGIWVAAGNGGSGLWYSTDGKTWTQSNQTSGSFASLYYGNGVWVAGAFSEGLWYSTNGKTWTQSWMPKVTFNVYYGNGVWVAGSDVGLYYSTNGIDWDPSNIHSYIGFEVSAYYANGLWVAGSDVGLCYSTDGKTWSQSDNNSYRVYSVYYANGLWVAGCDDGLWYSIDETIEVDF